MAKSKTTDRGKTLTRQMEEVREPPQYKVLLHNDDYTTMDFVVMILEQVFRKDTSEAARIMLNVHHHGVGIAGVYTREIGETKMAIVHSMARKHQYPLRCSLERVN